MKVKKNSLSETNSLSQFHQTHSQSHSLSFSETNPPFLLPPPPPPLPPQAQPTTAHSSSPDVFHSADERETEGRDDVVVEEEGQEVAYEEEYEEEDEGGDEDDGDVEEEDEDDEEFRDEEENEPVIEVTATAEQQAVKRQKLADGFYEVEAIRKKRTCKGEPQYLIKWRGWPESANTWEPVDHLQTCPDVVEAYEESLRSGQKKSSRKRKRKFTQPKKKMQYSYGASKSKMSPSKTPHSNEPHNSSVALPCGMVEVVVEHDQGVKISSAAKRADCNGSETVSPHFGSNDKNQGVLNCGQNLSGQNLDVHFQQQMPMEGDAPSICQSQANHVETGQDNQRRGAKRRKSGSVRRFTQDITSSNLDYCGNTVPVNVNSCDRVEQLILGESDAYRKRRADSTRSPAVITKLIKPISFSASVANNIQDVSVTFVAMRSDGKEVMVDNKFLKANNPLLLINFYEQHLRYTPN